MGEFLVRFESNYHDECNAACQAGHRSSRCSGDNEDVPLFWCELAATGITAILLSRCLLVETSSRDIRHRLY